MRAVLALALLALVSPAAVAGTATDPELTDPVGDTTVPQGASFADFTAAWLEATGGQLVLTIRLADYASAQKGACWDTPLRVNGKDLAVSTIVGADATDASGGSHTTTYGFEGNTNTTRATPTYGKPATLAIAFPKEVLTVKPGDIVGFGTFRSCAVMSGNTDVGGGGMPSEVPVDAPVDGDTTLDSAEASRSFIVPQPVVAAPPTTPAPKPAGNASLQPTTVEAPKKTAADATTNATAPVVENATRDSPTTSGEEVAEPAGRNWLPAPAPALVALAVVAAAVGAARRGR